MRGIEELTAYGEMHVANRRYVGLAPLEATGTGALCNVALVVDEARDGPQIAGHPDRYLFKTLATFPRLRDRITHAIVTRRTLTASRLAVYPHRLVLPGLLLIGDAAGYFDPFTGEGIFHALRSAELATEVVSEALTDGDLGADRLERYAQRYRREFRGKRAIEWIIQAAVQVPPLMNHIARNLSRRKGMADTIVAVTGDFLPPSAVLNPWFLVRLLR
jgi:flavin-dependent dehydrogenase